MSFRLPPADNPAVKLLVQVADVAVGHMNGGTILLPPKPVEVSTVPDMHMVLEEAEKHMVLEEANKHMVLEEADKHMVLEEAVVPTAVQLGRAFLEACFHDVFSRF